MFPRPLILALLFLQWGAAGATFTSQSRQFIIYAPERTIIEGAVPPGFVVIEASLLAVTAERVKEAVAREIPALRQSQSQVHIGIMERAATNTPIGIAATRYSDAWKYQALIPPMVEEARLAKALISTLLLEYANRGAERTAEIPAWVTEGLLQQIAFTVGPKLIVDRNSASWEATARDLQARTRESLRTNATPTFHDVTTSSVPPAKAPGEIFYQSSVHLLVRSLLQRPNGPQNFAGFLRMLPHTWNWQTAFLQSFGFERMLDVEKWWAMTAIEFTTRDQRQAWSTSASLQKLDDLLLTQVQFHNATNSLPETRQVGLKTILQDPNWTFQQQALNEKISQLAYTANHLSPQVGSLALAYKAALQSYVTKRLKAPVSPGLRATPQARAQALASEAMRKIDSLDARRRALSEPAVSSRP